MIARKIRSGGVSPAGQGNEDEPTVPPLSTNCVDLCDGVPVVNRRYEVVPDWERLPDGFHHDDVAGVSVDSRDHVYLLTRREARVIVYAPDGTFTRAWGEGFFSPRTHGLTVAPDDTVYCVDDGRHVVYHFSPKGELLRALGSLDTASQTGYDGGDLSTIARSAGPFNRPTNVAVAPTGEIFVSDGYGNARVHRFDAEGNLVSSWGEPGGDAGEFRLPHGIAVAQDGTVMVADRENDRIQLFDPDGTFRGAWTNIQRPTNIAVDLHGDVYVAELARNRNEPSGRLGSPDVDLPGRVSVLDSGGRLLARWGGRPRFTPGNFIAPHDIAVDSRGHVYVAEVAYTHLVDHGEDPAPCPTLQKFAPAGPPLPTL